MKSDTHWSVHCKKMQSQYRRSRSCRVHPEHSGYVMNIPEEEKCLYTKEELWARLVEFTGGRAAEEIVFGLVTTGASNDIEKATSIARSMITRYGMSGEIRTDRSGACGKTSTSIIRRFWTAEG